MRRPTIFSLMWLGCAILCAAASSVFAAGPTSVEQLAADAIRAGRTQDIHALKSLVGSLNHESRTVRRSSVWALSQIPESAAEFVSDLTLALADQDAQVRWGAATALGNIGRSAWPAEAALWKTTLDRDIEVRCAALIALRTVSVSKHSAAMPALIECLQCPVADVQSEGIATLAKIHSRWEDNEKQPLMPHLATMFACRNDDLRLAVAVLLGDLGLPAAPAMSALANASNDADEYVRAATLRAIGHFAEEVDQRWNQLDAAHRESLRQSCELVAKALAAHGNDSGEVIRLAERFRKLSDGIHLAASEQIAASGAHASVPTKARSKSASLSLTELITASPKFWRWVAGLALACAGAWSLRKVWSHFAAVRSEKIAIHEGQPNAANQPQESVSPAVPNTQREFGNVFSEVVRECATSTVTAALPTTVTQLLTAMTSNDPETRRCAITSLRSLGTSAVPELRAALADESAAVRARAAFVIGQFGPSARQAVSELARLVSDPDVSVRRNAASALGGIGSDAAVALPMLRQSACDADSGVRRCAVTALGLIDVDGSAPVLEQALRDPNAEVRRCAEAALRRRENSSVGDQPSTVGSPITLKVFRPDEADEPGLVELSEHIPDVTDFITQLEDTDSEARWRAAQALAQLGASAVPEMIASLNHRNPEVRRLLIVALGRVGADARAAVPSLLVALHDVNADVRSAAADCLGHLGVVSRPMLQALIESLSDMNAEVRRYAATTLGRFGQHAREATAALQIAAISDLTAKVRTAAQAALHRISESLVGVA